MAGELQGLTVREGDAVRAGQVIARIDATEFAGAAAPGAASRPARPRRRSTSRSASADNNKALVDQGFISPDRARHLAEQPERGPATWQAAVAAVELARKALDDTVLRAPIAGVVAQRLAQPGERVGVDARVVEIVDLSRLELEATLCAADSRALRVGQPAQLQIEGMAKPVAARWCASTPAPRPAAAACWPTWRWRTRPGCARACSPRAGWRTAATRRWRCRWRPCAPTRPAPYVQVVDDGAVAHRPVTPGARGAVDGESWVAVEVLPTVRW